MSQELSKFNLYQSLSKFMAILVQLSLHLINDLHDHRVYATSFIYALPLWYHNSQGKPSIWVLPLLLALGIIYLFIWIFLIKGTKSSNFMSLFQCFLFHYYNSQTYCPPCRHAIIFLRPLANWHGPMPQFHFDPWPHSAPTPIFLLHTNTHALHSKN